MKYRQLGARVAPLSTPKIQRIAQSLRDMLGMNQPYFDILTVVELCFRKYEIVPNYDFQIDYEHRIKAEALTFPDQGVIQVAESVYDKAVDGDYRSRFTIAHEVGHLLLHRNQSISHGFARQEHQCYEDSEWQADTFASLLLVDRRLLEPNFTVEQISEKFGVSLDAARQVRRKLAKRQLKK